MKKFFNDARKIVYLVFLLFPVLTSLILSSSVLIRKNKIYAVSWFQWPTIDNDAINIASLVFASLFFVLLLRLSDGRHNQALRILLYVSFAVKIAIVLLFWNTINPTSDSLYSWMIANEIPGYQEKLAFWHAYYPAWANWDAICRLLAGIIPNYSWFVLINTIFNCLSGLLVFKIVKNISGENNTALLAACVYSWYFPQMIYNLWNVPDTVSVFFFLLAVYLLFEEKMLCSVFAGVAFGIGDCFKPIAIIYIIALSVVLLYETIADGKKIMRNVYTLTVIALLSLCIPKIVKQVSEDILDAPIYNSPVADFLCKGLRTDGEGQLEIGKNALLFISLRNEGYSEEYATEAVRCYLKDDWSNNLGDVPRMLFKKIEWAWQDDFRPCSFLFDGKIDTDNLNSSQQKVTSFIKRFGPSISQSDYIVLMLFVAIGGIEIFKSKYYENPKMFFIWLFIFGFSMLLLLSEAQSRYKSNAIPLFCVFASIGAYDFWKGRKMK